MALMGGLNHICVARLKATWEKVPAKAMQDFTKYSTLFELSKNYKNYREAIKACKPPLIPYLALFPKDLMAIEEAPTFLEGNLVNFNKLRQLTKLIKYISHIQQPLYVHIQDPVLHNYLQNKLGGSQGLLTEAEMTALSNKIQPFSFKV